MNTTLLIEEHIKTLSEEIQELVGRKDTLGREMSEIDIRITQLVGAVQELTHVLSKIKTAESTQE